LPPAFSYCGGGTCTGGGATFTGGGRGGVKTTGAAGGLAGIFGDGDGEGVAAEEGADARGVGVENSGRGDSDAARAEPRSVLAGDGGVMKTVRLPARPIMGGGGEEEDPIPSPAHERGARVEGSGGAPLAAVARDESSEQSRPRAPVGKEHETPLQTRQWSFCPLAKFLTFLIIFPPN
jgi:hypothetical protein